MYRIVILVALLASFTTARSQVNGDHFNLGLGFHGWGIPVYGSYDWEFRGDFNLGVGASVSLDTDGPDEGLDGNAFGAGFFTQWYADRVLDAPSEFDVYAGAGVFYYSYRKGDDLDLNLFIGGRYFFNSKTAINLELGGGSALAGGKIGVSWRL
ncbi:MAG: hypothetical protein HKN79_06010 [Flavobacteriales bacterium]|nr:hypothetical protein [Flavobacteriales bacterium]